MLERSRKEALHKKRILEKVRGFIRKAQALGLEEKRWERYNARIEELVTFEELGKILRQTVNTPGYYFLPQNLRIKKDFEAELKNRSKRSGPESHSGTPDEKGDVLLRLEGTFLVRR